MNRNDLGFVFETGFNIGILSCLPEKFKEREKKFLLDKSYVRSAVYTQFIKKQKITDEWEINFYKQNIDFLLFKGLLSGRNCFNEWINEKTNGKKYEVEYFQAGLYKALSSEKNEEDNRNYYIKRLKEELNIETGLSEKEILFKTGEAMRADTIVLIKQKKKYHLLVIDNSINLNHAMTDYENPESLKNSLEMGLFNKRLKSCFSNIAVDSSNIEIKNCNGDENSESRSMDINAALYNYIKGIGIDKPLYKMIQAGSYAESFIRLITAKNQKNPIEEEQIKSVCIAGYTDEEMCSINLNNKQFDFLNTCAKIYKSSKENLKELYTEKYKHKDLKIINRNFKKIFKITKDQMIKLETLKEGMNIINFREKFDDYTNTSSKVPYNNKMMPLRDVHAEEVKKYIEDKDTHLIFLTGNPGIGKTTAVVEYLKQQDGYLFIYVSPRTQVNADIKEKFSVKAKQENLSGEENLKKLYDDDAVYLNANGNDEKSINGVKADIVNFKSNKKDVFENIKEDVVFLDDDRERKFEKGSVKFEDLNKNVYQTKQNKNAGVLKRVTTGINKVIAGNFSSKIIATASVQSLKAVEGTGTTARHFKKIFETIYNEKTGVVSDKSFKKFAEKFHTVIFMVDEITGDEGGTAFLDELIKITFKEVYKAVSDDLKKLVNFKIIAADASITNEEIIKAHVKDSKTDTDKIYFKKCSKDDKEIIQPVYSKKFKYGSISKTEGLNAVCINTNSYPAKSLALDYELLLNKKKINKKDSLYSKELSQNIDMRIAEEASEIIAGDKNKQVIIYVQDIQRSGKIEEELKKFYKSKMHKNFEKEKDYIIINSTLSEYARKKVFEVKDDVKIVIMTSSASRGLSFPKTTHMLVDVPRFNIEKNLMEIIQLIYRGRGNTKSELETDKYIKFFIGDNIYYTENDSIEQRENRVNEHLMNIYTLIMLLRASIRTRIYGKDTISGEDVCIIPVGGKGIGALSDALIEKFSSLIKNLEKEYYKDRSNTAVKNLKDILNQFMNNNTIKTKQDIYNNTKMQNIKSQFDKCLDSGIVNLLDFRPFKDCMVYGDMLIFNLSNDVDAFLEFGSAMRDKFLGENSNMHKWISSAQKNKNIPQQLKNQLNDLNQMLWHLEYNENPENKISKSLKDSAKSFDCFAAIPMAAPFVCRNFEEYKENGDFTFKKIIKDYVKTGCSIGEVLPITDEYKDFPFIIFRSSNLLNMRERFFNSRYMFCSSKINFLNLLLVIKE